ncbi:MAG: hypothetical protein ACFE9Z_06600 [Promethearchaeota archaeon]
MNFNRNREILKQPSKTDEVVRIPLTPFTLNANLLYYLFEILYPRFINDQNNILDIILTETEKKNKVGGLYLYQTLKAGIHSNVESLPEDLIKIKTLEIEDLDEIFNKIQRIILKEKKIRISSIRIFKKQALELINNHCEGILDLSTYDFFSRITNLIQNFIQQDLFLIYPEPVFIKFIKKSLKLLKGLQIQSIIKLIEEILPEFRIALFLGGAYLDIVVLLQKKITKSGTLDLKIKIFTSEELGIEIDKSNINNNLGAIQKKLNTVNVYYFNQTDIISFLSDFFELMIPVKRNNIKFLLQKILFGYRSFEKHWNIIPRPAIYNTLVRFIVRVMGLNLNLRKISHWAIPELIFNYINLFIGLNSKVLIILTNIRKDKEKKLVNSISKLTCEQILLLESEQNILKEIKIMKKEDIFIESPFISIDSIKKSFSTTLGYISSIIVIDKFLIQTLIKNFLIKSTKFSIFPKIKTLKLLKDNRYFKIYPEFPPYKFLIKKNSRSILKLILPIFIDKHEF